MLLEFKIDLYIKMMLEVLIVTYGLFQVLEVDEDLVFKVISLSLRETLEKEVGVHVHELALGRSIEYKRD